MMARVWLASQRAQKAEVAPIAVPAPAKSVLIAKNPVPRGQILRADDLAWEQWPEGGIDRSYILLGTRTPWNFAALGCGTQSDCRRRAAQRAEDHRAWQSRLPRSGAASGDARGLPWR